LYLSNLVKRNDSIQLSSCCFIFYTNKITSTNSHIFLNICLFLCVWLYSPLDLGRFFSFLILYTVGRAPWTREQPVARPLTTHRTTQTQNKRKHTSMPRVVFEPMTPVLVCMKKVHDSVRPLWLVLNILLCIISWLNNKSCTGRYKITRYSYWVIGMTYWIIGSRKPRLTAVGIRCAEHATLSIRKIWH
jgi:hypothetical protein